MGWYLGGRFEIFIPTFTQQIPTEHLLRARDDDASWRQHSSAERGRNSSLHATCNLRNRQETSGLKNLRLPWWCQREMRLEGKTGYFHGCFSVCISLHLVGPLRQCQQCLSSWFLLMYVWLISASNGKGFDSNFVYRIWDLWFLNV